MKKVEVQLFAALTDHFGRNVAVELNGDQKVTGVVDALEKQNPNAAGLLKDCRFAVNENFVDLNYELSDGEKIFIIPPSSGG
jgi:molybdopterin synthase sulfur carrier subunit